MTATDDTTNPCITDAMLEEMEREAMEEIGEVALHHIDRLPSRSDRRASLLRLTEMGHRWLGEGMIRVPGHQRDLYNEEVRDTVDYIRTRPGLADCEADAAVLLACAIATPTGALIVPITGALAIVALGCIQISGGLVHEATEKRASAATRSEIRQAMQALRFWCTVAERVEDETGVVVS